MFTDSRIEIPRKQLETISIGLCAHSTTVDGDSSVRIGDWRSWYVITSRKHISLYNARLAFAYVVERAQKKNAKYKTEQCDKRYL